MPITNISNECLELRAETQADTTSLSHWAYYPPIPETDCFQSPQAITVLVASVGGRFAIVNVSLRKAPDVNFAGSLARLLDEEKYRHAPIANLVGEFWRRTSLTIELNDGDLDFDCPILLTSAVSRSLARTARTKTAGFSKSISLIQMKTELAGQLALTWLNTRRHFVSRLCQEAVMRARGIDGLKPSTYALVNTQDPIECRRIEAMMQWPMLKPCLLSPEYSHVLKTVDSGGVLVDALAAHHSVPKVFIRVLRKVKLETLGSLSENINVLFALLREIPVDYLPRDTSTWEKFVVAVETIRSVSKDQITSPVCKSWLQRFARNAYVLPVRTPQDLADIGLQINIFITHLLHVLSWAVTLGRVRQFQITREASDVVDKFKAEVGLNALAKMAKEFAANYRVAYDSWARESLLWDGLAWPALAGGTHKFGDIKLVQLLSPRELSAEGKAMSHCSALYVQFCMTGSVQVWSIQHSDGHRLATLDTEIRSHPNGTFYLKIRQCVGYGNKAATDLANDAANDLVLTLSLNSELMTPFVEWARTNSGKSLEPRERHALMAPLANSVAKSLAGKFSWPNLIAMAQTS